MDSLAPFAKSNQGLPLRLSPHEVYFVFQLDLVRIVTNVARNPGSKAEASFSSSSVPKTVKIPTQRTSASIMVSQEVVSPIDIWKEYFEDPEMGEKRRLLQRTYETLWHLGFHIHLSNHFRTDLVVYTADPLLVHASFLVICVPSSSKLRVRDLMSFARLSNSVKKTLLFATHRNQASNSQTRDTIVTKACNGPIEGTSESIYASNSSNSKSKSNSRSTPSSDASTGTILKLDAANDEGSISFLECSWKGVS